MFSMPTKGKIEVKNTDGKVIETYTEVSDFEFFDKLEEFKQEIYTQAQDLKSIELLIYGSPVSENLEFKEEDLLTGNDLYKDLKSTMTLTARATEAYLKAEEPIEEFDLYFQKAKDFTQCIANYIDCLNACVEERMSYFISDKNHLRAIATENLEMAGLIMSVEENPDDYQEMLKDRPAPDFYT